MGERFYYQEELFFTRDEDRELGENQEKNSGDAAQQPGGGCSGRFF